MQADGEKVTIAVMDSEARFNITRGATFTDIIFRGDYALLSDTSNEATKTMTKKCEIDETIADDEWPLYQELKFTSASSANDCIEPNFQVAEVDIDDDREDCIFTQSIGSVRSCKGEAYSEDYDTVFSGGTVKYLRHKVLFNLYNFDLDQSRFKSDGTVPLVELTLTNCEFKYFLDDYEALIYVETSIIERVDTLFSSPYIV